MQVVLKTEIGTAAWLIKPHAAEAPRVSEAKFGVQAGNDDSKMGVLFELRFAWHHHEPASHAQAKNKRCGRIQIEHDPFCPTIDAHDAPSGHDMRKIDLLCFDDVAACQIGVTEKLTGKSGVKLSGDGLGLGQFGHIAYLSLLAPLVNWNALRLCVLIEIR